MIVRAAALLGPAATVALTIGALFLPGSLRLLAFVPLPVIAGLLVLFEESHSLRRGWEDAHPLPTAFRGSNER